MADRFASRGYSLKKQTRWSNDKTIIELGYGKISWFVSVSQINYLPQPSASANNWSARLTDKSRYFAQPRSIIVNYLQLYKRDIEEYKARHDNRKWGLFPFNMPCCYQIWATPLHMNVNSLLPVDVHPLKRRINFRFRGKLPTYPSPKPSFCPKWQVSINVNLGEG